MADSDPEGEADELLWKLQPLLNALDMTAAIAWIDVAGARTTSSRSRSATAGYNWRMDCLKRS